MINMRKRVALKSRCSAYGLRVRAMSARAAVVGVAICSAATALAQEVNAEQFYSGRTIRLIVGSSAGGGTDTVARLLARHMGKYILGKPNIVVVNQPGGGGLVGANRIANTAPRDGSEFATMERAIPQFAFLRDPNVHFDPLALTWLGSLSSYKNDAFMLLVNADNAVGGVDDLRGGRLGVKLGASQQGSTNLTFALIARDVLGLNVQPISGYAGTARITLAMTAREVDGQLMGIMSIQSSQRHLWDNKLVRPLVQFARKERHPLLPDVPTGRELLTDEAALALLDFA
jgi:tripartite-type tricarboxylate transporter receptor subunit TctC